MAKARTTKRTLERENCPVSHGSRAARHQAARQSVKSADVALHYASLGEERGCNSSSTCWRAREKLFDSWTKLQQSRYDAVIAWMRLKAASGQLVDADFASLESAWVARDKEAQLGDRVESVAHEEPACLTLRRSTPSHRHPCAPPLLQRAQSCGRVCYPRRTHEAYAVPGSPCSVRAQLKDVNAGVVLLQVGEANSFVPVALWPEAPRDLSHLGAVAQKGADRTQR